MTCEQPLDSYTSCNYQFIIFFLDENIYIAIDNVNKFKKGFCLKNIPDTLINI